jgi:hypothetical protein
MATLKKKVMAKGNVVGKVVDKDEHPVLVMCRKLDESLDTTISEFRCAVSSSRLMGRRTADDEESRNYDDSEHSWSSRQAFQCP